MMTVVRSTLFALLFYPGTLLFVIAALAMVPFGAHQVRVVSLAWVDFYHWLARRVVGIQFSVEGRIPTEPVMIAAKHQAMVETLELVRLANRPVIVLKRELVAIPLFGRVLRKYGVIPVDRKAGAKALRAMLAAGTEALGERRLVVIFPEGTRVPPGTTPPLQSGFAGLYRALGMPVVPVALDSGKLWTRGLLKHPGTIRFVFGEPIPPSLSRAEIEARVHYAINILER